MRTHYSRRAGAGGPARGRQWHCLLMAMVLGSAASAIGDDKPTGADTNAVLRARSCVLKVECHDRSGTGSPTVLSAVALDDSGYIVTVGLRSPGEGTIFVKDCAGKSHEARWVAGDDLTGLSLLKLEPGIVQSPTMITAFPVIGSEVFVIGNPFGLSHSVSSGVVSGLDRSVTFSGGISRGLIQFTAPVFPGDGGGLLADRNGQMLGIVSTALKEPGADGSSENRIHGIGFAIPAAETRRIVQRLREGKRVERGYLGLTAEDVEGVGVRVLSVFNNSPAETAGIRDGDVVEALDDRVVDNFDDLAGRIERLRPGTQVTLRLNRAGEQVNVEATLGDRPALPAAPRRFVVPLWPGRPENNPPGTRGELDRMRPGARSDFEGAMLGIHTQPITESLAKSLGLPTNDGALISSVVRGSSAERAGLQASDVIMSLNDEPVRSPSQLHERIRQLEPGTGVRLRIVRDGETKEIDVTLMQAAPSVWSDETMRRGVPWPADPLRNRLELLEERVKMLEDRLRELEKRLDVP